MPVKRTGFVLLTWLFVLGCTRVNHAPDAPAAPTGPSVVTQDSLAGYTSAATDLDGDSVSIRFDWGNGDTSEWSSYVGSGVKVLKNYTWHDIGTDSVRAQAMDRDSLTSDWSLPKPVQVQTPADWWGKTFGGASDDYGYSVQRTSDGGYVIAGRTGSSGAGGDDVWLVKTDAIGHEVWDRTYGGAGGDIGYSVERTPDGGYVIAGSTESYGAGDWDVWLIKTDADGNKLWDRTFGGANGDEGYSVQPTSDGGYVVVGRTSSSGAGQDDVWLIKTDADGNRVWDRTFGGEVSDYGNSVRQTSDGGYVIAGTTWTYGVGWDDVWLIKTDAAGNRLWDRTFGGGFYDRGHSVQLTPDGGYIIAGSTQSWGAGDWDVWLIKTDASGYAVWDRTFGGTNADEGHSVQRTSDGGYVIAGHTYSYGAGWGDVWLIKTDANGNKVWDRTFGGKRYDVGESVQPTSDGKYVIAGYTWSYGAGYGDFWLVKAPAPETTAVLPTPAARLYRSAQPE